MKNYYKVTKEDLIGELEGFPIEVVQKMVDEQVKQGNKADVSVFQKDKKSDCKKGGFYWFSSELGAFFWLSVINGDDFDLFFSKYPKETSTNTDKYCNLYHNNATMKFKTGEHTYDSNESAYENRKDDIIEGYRYFTTIECSIKE